MKKINLALMALVAASPFAQAKSHLVFDISVSEPVIKFQNSELKTTDSYKVGLSHYNGQNITLKAYHEETDFKDEFDLKYTQSELGYKTHFKTRFYLPISASVGLGLYKSQYESVFFDNYNLDETGVYGEVGLSTSLGKNTFFLSLNAKKYDFKSEVYDNEKYDLELLYKINSVSMLSIGQSKQGDIEALNVGFKFTY